MSKNKNDKPQLVDVSFGNQIKAKLSELSKKDGLKRTQRWLSQITGIPEVKLSNLINNVDDWEQDYLDNINGKLNMELKLENNPKLE